jgi:hypothetical protein
MAEALPVPDLARDIFSNWHFIAQFGDFPGYSGVMERKEAVQDVNLPAELC